MLNIKYNIFGLNFSISKIFHEISIRNDLKNNDNRKVIRIDSLEIK